MNSGNNSFHDLQANDTQLREETKENSDVTVLLPSALTESFEIVLARVLDLYKEGVPTAVLYCNGGVKGCVANPFGLASACRHCCRVRDKAIGDLIPDIRSFSLETYFTDFTDEHEKYLEYTNEQLSVGVNSTVLTFYRLDVHRLSKLSPRGVLFRSISTRYLYHSQFVFFALKNFLQAEETDRIEFFNGRITPTRAAMLAASSSFTDFGVIEVSGQGRQIFLSRNVSIHDLHYNQQRLQNFVDSGTADLVTGTRFFESRRNGISTDARSFTQRQKYGELSVKDSRPILAIFTSSADELQVAGKQWFTSASNDPIWFILQLADLLDSTYRLIVRMHPNQAGDRTGAAQKMQKLFTLHPRIELLRPQDCQSTYELIDASAAVLTFGSTVGLEATFWGKPSILCGRATWERLDVAYFAESPSKVSALLKGGIPAKSKSDSIIAGAFYMAGSGKNGSLAWQSNGTIGFTVDGRSYLQVKRASLSYWITRLIDKILRII